MIVPTQKYGQLIIKSLSYTSMVCAIGGLQKSGKFTCSGDTFQGCWLLLILMIVLTQKYGQLIIKSLSYTSMVCAIGGLQKRGKFTCSGDTFQGCWLLLQDIW